MEFLFDISVFSSLLRIRFQYLVIIADIDDNSQ